MSLRYYSDGSVTVTTDLIGDGDDASELAQVQGVGLSGPRLDIDDSVAFRRLYVVHIAVDHCVVAFVCDGVFLAAAGE